MEHHPMRYVLHVCGLRDIPSQTRLIEFEGLENIEDLAHYTDSELDTMAEAFSFERYLTRMNKAFKELDNAGQPMYAQQKLQLLLCSIKCDNKQVQTTMGIIRDRYFNDFDGACLTFHAHFRVALPQSNPVSTNALLAGRHLRLVMPVAAAPGGALIGAKKREADKVEVAE